ncbi:hypothetical protein D4L85_17425 [Chryseolinea soli]|uniref:Uncharacterized protein n=1 Tax=Chryseolinea soli TaxID=2321403 RepID=A0A385SML9_9BACT|nr:hypothetical protein D4L85_17425 [Chryseolinea soli]
MINHPGCNPCVQIFFIFFEADLKIGPWNNRSSLFDVTTVFTDRAVSGRKVRVSGLPDGSSGLVSFGLLSDRFFLSKAPKLLQFNHIP